MSNQEYEADLITLLDDENVEHIYAEAFDDTGLGQAVMNRLLKAAGHRVIKV